MKPVLVLQHLMNDGPAYLATWLRGQGVALDLRCTERGEAFPATLHGHRALAILGGAMSANDPMPSLRQAEALVREAFQLGMPVIGHCLGGQLMARAMGAPVVASPAPEVGWQPLRRRDCVAARAWLGDDPQGTVFQWHFESFDLPTGATLLAGSDTCPNQAFSIGPHLALQFHIEIDEAKLRAWASELDAGYAPARRAHGGSVQSVDEMLSGIAPHMARHHAMADRIYRRWLGGAV